MSGARRARSVPHALGEVVTAMSAVGEPTRTDFFVSYTKSDEGWAEWIAWQLEEAGYRVVIQAWDFRPGHNFIEEMHRATQSGAKTLAVLSRAYLERPTLAQSEWQAGLREDPSGRARALMPVRVGECEPGGLLGSIVYVDLVDLDEAAARDCLLRGAQDKRARPVRPPVFPGPKPPFPPDPSDDPPPVEPTHSEQTTPPPPWPPPREPGPGVLDRLAKLLRRPRSVAALAAVVLLIAVVIVAVIVWPRADADDPTFTQVGVSPRSLAFGLGADDRLWVADPTQPEAWRLDASEPRVRTGRVFLSESARPAGVAVDTKRNVAWVVDERNDRAWKIDIPNRRVDDWVPVGDGPQAVAVADDVVWVANLDGSVSRIDARNGQLVDRKISISRRLNGIATDGGAVWVIDTRGDIVLRIDADVPTRTPREYPAEGPRSITVEQGAAWAANRDGTVSRIDDSGPPTKIDVGDELCGISVGESGVWVSAPADDRVWRIDPASNETSGEPVQVEDAPCAVAAGHGAVWVANRGDSSISRVEP